MQPGNPRIALCAHAKINWALDITGVRPDGYHDVDLLMQSITLCDDVILTPAEELILDAPGSPLGNENIAWHAAVLLAQQAGVACHAHIQIKKRIPSQAGLGGGSADAAAVLAGLNRLWGLNWPLPRLTALALRLGADVPFQLQGGLCRATGIGEQLTALPVPDYWLLLAQPDRGASTRAVYQAYDRIGSSRRPNMDALVSAIFAQQPFLGLLANALEDAAQHLVPEIGDLMIQLAQLGALHTRMTGSGSCVFGVFAGREQAEQAKTQLNAPFKAVCRTCRHSLSTGSQENE